jgi:alpha-glucosidase
MVNFHGCSKPTGLERAYPNIVNYEAVRGAECSKWDLTANPDHHLDVLFTRMLAGPLDYTPGSMRNKTKELFKPIDPGLPSSQGTRCHELSMYVLFDQPFAMLCDAPAEYRKYPDIMKFLSAIPTTFDDTKVLGAKRSEYAIIAKRKGDDWFVGAMTNWIGRDQSIDFSFLPEGKVYKADVYLDGKDADTDATQYDHNTMEITNKTKLNIRMANGGGSIVYLHQ